MSKLYLDWLDKTRRQVFTDFPHFVSNGALGGGTALALQLNHRKSFDFDVFLTTEVPSTLFPKISRFYGIRRLKLLNDSREELSFLIDSAVKVTCLYYPFPPLYPKVLSSSIPLFNVKDLGTDKVYTIGRRPAYRDYVDLYFLLKKRIAALPRLIKDAEKRFGGGFNEKLFLEQLVYLDDLKDFAVTFLGKSVRPEAVKFYFTKLTKEYLKDLAVGESRG